MADHFVISIVQLLIFDALSSKTNDPLAQLFFFHLHFLDGVKSFEGVHLLAVLALELIPYIDEAFLNYFEFFGFLLQKALSL